MNSIYYVPTETPCSPSSKASPHIEDDEIGIDDGRQGKLSRGQSRIEFERLAQFFHVPINEAAKGLGVCATVLKKVCRKYGIPRWPHRKIKKLDTLLSMLETSAAKTSTSNPHHDEDVRKKIESVSRDRMILLTEGKLDEACGSSKSRAGQKRSKADDAKLKGRDRKKRRVDLNSSNDDIDSISSPEDGSATSSGYASPVPPGDYEFAAIEFASVEFSPPEFVAADCVADYAVHGFSNQYVSTGFNSALSTISTNNFCLQNEVASVPTYVPTVVPVAPPQPASNFPSYSALSTLSAIPSLPAFPGNPYHYDYTGAPFTQARNDTHLLTFSPVWADDGSVISSPDNSSPQGPASPACYPIIEQGNQQSVDNSPFMRFFSAVDMSLMQGAM